MVAARSNVSANHLLYLFVDRVMVVRDVSDTAYVCMCVCVGGWVVGIFLGWFLQRKTHDIQA